MLTPEQLDAMQSRADAATPGPWRWSDWSVTYGNMERPDRRLVLEVSDQPKEPVIAVQGEPLDAVLYLEEDAENPADKEFIAHARDDVPALVAECRRLQEIEKATDAFVNMALGMHSAHWWRLQGDLIDLGAMLPSWNAPVEDEKE